MADVPYSLTVLWANNVGASSEEDPFAHFNKVVKSYQEPHRAYHTLEHLEELAGLLSVAAFKLSRQEMRVLVAALFYHDVVYNIPAADKSNEELSADIAANDLRDLSYGEDFIDRVRKIILATRTHKLEGNEGKAAEYFLDMDMAILGAGEERYKEYMQQVRREFNKFSDEQFYPARLNSFIQPTLDNGHIFSTPEFRRRFEAPALRNLEYEKQFIRSLGF